MLRAYELTEQPNREAEDTLVAHISARKVLLVIDNCEHLLSACARLIDALLSACSALRVVATSREALRVEGERLYEVTGLAVPSPGALPPLEALRKIESVRLFADRAGASDRAFRLDETTASDVSEICGRLEGNPLAIELAAARGKLGVKEIAGSTRLLPLLQEGPRTGPGRHRAMEVTIEWSHALLTTDEQVLFRRLSVFRGDFTMDSARRVCAGDDLDDAEIINLLLRLEEQSLLAPEQACGGSVARGARG